MKKTTHKGETERQREREKERDTLPPEEKYPAENQG